MRSKTMFLAAGCVVIFACKEKSDSNSAGSLQGAPPPSVQAHGGSSSAPTESLCASSTAAFKDPKIAAVLPIRIGNFCVLDKDVPQSYGEGTSKKIDDISDLIDGAGDTYTRNYFAKRYDSVKYVDGSGSGAQVEIALSTFDKPENAYALFTYRVVANTDPDPEAARKAGRRGWKPLPGAGAAALGNAAALMWKGVWLAEMTYTPDPNKTMQEATAAADAVLPAFVEAIASKVIGATDPPADVRALPRSELLPLGIEYVPPKYSRPEGKVEALKLPTVGGYAIGYVKENGKRYRVLSFAREEKDGARDVMEAFRKMTPSVTLKDKESFDDAVYFAFEVGAGGASAAGKAEGVAARRGTLVMAIIDEEHALGDPSAKDLPYPRLTKEEKTAKLKALMSGKPAPVGSSSQAPLAPTPSGAKP